MREGRGRCGARVRSGRNEGGFLLDSRSMGKSAVVAVTPDPGLARTLRSGVAAAGLELRVVATAAELDAGPVAAELLIFHLTRADDPDGSGAGSELSRMAELAQRLPDDGSVLAVVPHCDLAASLTAMRQHPRVAAVLVQDGLRASDLTAMSARLVVGGIFGIEKILPWGSRVHSVAVGDEQEAAEAMRRISTFAVAMGLRRIHRMRIEQSCGEMIGNALADASRAARSSGQDPATDGAPPRPNGSRRPDSADVARGRVVVEFGCDGRHFAVGVRDPIGRLERGDFLSSLRDCVEPKPPGQPADDGERFRLAAVSRSASRLLVNLRPGIATECICAFDLDAPRAEMGQIGLFHERVADGDRRFDRGRRFDDRDDDRRLESRADDGLQGGDDERGLDDSRDLDLRELDGGDLDGDAPLGDDDGEPDQKREGEPRPPRARRRRGSTARIARRGKRSLTAAGALFLLGLSGLAIALFHWYGSGANPQAAARVGRSQPERSAPARPEGSLSITANVPGRVTVAGSAGCRERPLPLLRCPLPDGLHTVVVESSEAHLRHSFTVEVRGKPVERALRLGYVEARPGYWLRTPTGVVPRLALPEGRQTVTLIDGGPGSSLELEVPVRGDKIVFVP